MQKEAVEKRVLYVGSDDSNHAGRTKGEIIVNTFSVFIEDHLIKHFGKRANYSEFEEWLNKGGDYRFTILFGEATSHPTSNLPYASCYLIKNYLEENNLILDELNIYFDGPVSRTQKLELKNFFPCVPKLRMEYFIKKQDNHHCPRVVYMADVLANYLYREYVSHVLQHDKFVVIKD